MKKILLSLFVSVIGFVGFSSAVNLPGFTKIYEHHFTNCIIDSLAEGTAGNICDGNNRYLYKPTDLGIYCVSFENISLSTYANYGTTNVISLGLGILANYSSANNSFLRLSHKTFVNYSLGNLTEDIVLCGTNFISGNSADFLVNFTSAMSNIFNNFSLSFDARMYYLPYNFNNSSLCSGYVSDSNYNECVSDLASCNSLLSGYSSSLDSCSNSYNSCSSSLNSCLQANCPGVDIPLNSFSNVYVYKNDNYFQITGSNNIYVNLPSYLGYNYDYSNEGQDLNLSIAVSQDSGYLQDVQDIQYSTPNNIDFNNIITNVLPAFVPGLVLILFIYFVFRFIKKIF